MKVVEESRTQSPRFYYDSTGAHSYILGVRPPVQFLGLIDAGSTIYSARCSRRLYRYLFSAYDDDGVKHVLCWDRDNFYGNNPEGCPQIYIFRNWVLRPINSDNHETSYELIITDSTGRKYKARGKEEPTYSVDCGECPPGTIRCSSDTPPGYCCLPCKEVRTRINSLAARI
ncbi:hypothetical protein P0S91_10975 [Gloeocapsopsis dulcis]|nr:hypothetical protein [Gloeocapsopsis dulcis]WNN91555.1 hypothetical protein P0S91_10975 [Gloeocapsopsis dulcis]